MRKLLSTRYNAGAFNFGLLVLRLGAGILMAYHGYMKLENYDEISTKFTSFLGLSPAITLGLVIFAELVCALLIAIGLFTRFACIPLIISCTYAMLKAHQGDIFGKGELVTLFLIAFLTLLFTGPGKASVDSMISK
jgi:putative oxidoreductase